MSDVAKILSNLLWMTAVLLVLFPQGLSLSADEEPHMTLTIAGPNVEPLSDSAGDPLLTQLQERFHLDFEPVAVHTSDASYTYLLLSAINDLPDIMIYNTSLDFNYFIQNGALRPLPDKMYQYPNLQVYLAYPYAHALQYEGKLWGLPRVLYSEETNLSDSCVVLNRELFMETGEAIPETMEQWYTLLEKVKAAHPELYPLTAYPGDTLFNLTHYYAPATNNWVWQESRYLPGYMTQEYLDSIEALRPLWRDNLIDPEFMDKSTGRPSGLDHFLLGQAFAMVYSTSPHEWMSELIPAWTALYPERSIEEGVVLAFLPPNAEGQYIEAPSLTPSSLYFGSNVGDDKMERILTMLDWLSSNEGRLMRRYGIEGEDYKMVNGHPVCLNQDGAQSLYSKYPSYSALRVLPDLDLTFFQEIPDANPIVNQLNSQYKAWREHISPQRLYTASMRASTMLSWSESILSPDIPEMSFYLLSSSAPINQAFEQIKAGLDAQGLESMIDRVNWRLSP